MIVLSLKIMVPDFWLCGNGYVEYSKVNSSRVVDNVMAENKCAKV